LKEKISLVFLYLLITIGLLIIISIGNMSAQIGLNQNHLSDSNTEKYLRLKSEMKESTLICSSSDSIQNSSEFEDPNSIPYQTRKSIGYHILAFPSTVWRLLWYPLGKTTIWIDQNRIHLKVAGFFLNDDMTGGFFPIMNIGGNMGFAPGVMAFHHNLFNKKKSINFSSLFASLDNNYTKLAYSDKSLFRSSLQFNFSGHFISDSEENHFSGGNKGTKDNRSVYDIEEGKVQLGFGYDLSKRINWQLLANMKHTNISTASEEEYNTLPVDIAGFGTTKLWGIGTGIAFDFRNGWPRTLSGTLIKINYHRYAEISYDRFQFNYYAVEAQQFVPVPFLARNRRLSFRGRLENRQEIFGKEIPFYELSMAGDADNLRGFDQNRFRAKGSVFFNFEYRYPIWDTWDAVIFLDEGQVFDEYEDITFDNFHWAVGAGLRLMTKTGFLLRLEFGYSKERVRALFELSPNF
jgi:hypothetical protein